MPDLRLKSIELRNWMTVKTARIEFPDKGLVLVIGSNLAAEGKFESIGAGKTALGEALARTLLGVVGRYAHLGYFVSNTAKGDLYVKVEAELLQKPFIVEMGFRCKELAGEGEALRFVHGDHEAFQAVRAEQNRAQLERILQVTPELANWTTFIDGDRLKFNRMSQQDSVNLLMTALAQPPWTEYFELAAQKLQSANQQLSVSLRAVNNSKISVENLEANLAAAREDHREAQEEYQRQVDELARKIDELKNQIGADRAAVRSAEQVMAGIKKKLKLLEDQKAAQNHQWEIERQGLRDQLAQLDESWTTAVQTRTQRSGELSGAEGTLDTMLKVPKNCPTCGKSWDKQHSAVEIEKAEKKAAQAQAALDAAESVYTACGGKRKRINGRIQQIEQDMREQGRTEEVESLGDDYQRNEKMARNLNAMIQQREINLARLEQGVDATFVNKKLAVVEERSRALEAGKLAVNQAASELAMDQEALKVVQYWHKAFGPTGIPNMILSDAVPILNRVAQRISNLMTGGTLQVNYSTTRQLVSGESRAQLVTKIVNRIGSSRVEGSSKGEGGLTNLIIAENLNEIGQVSNRVGFRFYDEITSGQDATVRRSIFAYLKEVADRMGILIFVVDHHSEAANYADYVLVAEKTKEHGTTYCWR